MKIYLMSLKIGSFIKFYKILWNYVKPYKIISFLFTDSQEVVRAQLNISGGGGLFC